MNNRKSSIFNLNESLVVALIWVVSSVMSFSAESFPTVIAVFLILKFERKSHLVRNHAGQAMIASIVAMFLSFGLNFITSFFVILLSWIPVLNTTTLALSQIVRLALNILILAYLLIGLLKAVQMKRLSLPVIGKLGDQLSDSIRP